MPEADLLYYMKGILLYLPYVPASVFFFSFLYFYFFTEGASLLKAAGFAIFSVVGLAFVFLLFNPGMDELWLPRWVWFPSLEHVFFQR
ncbi:MAG TPA: hypothetical protein VJ179_04060 [Patescibacteria group bacterium]|nr:hypothetical protein [Patescibacteria group bacterium]